MYMYLNLYMNLNLNMNMYMYLYMYMIMYLRRAEAPFANTTQKDGLKKNVADFLKNA